jgi:hypothetical protein
MATVTPAGTAAESSTLNTVVGAIALIALIALVYFIARGRTSAPGVVEKEPVKPAQQQMEPSGQQPHP